MSSQERDFGKVLTVNFLAEMQRVGLPDPVVARRMDVSEKQVARWRKGQTPRIATVERWATYFERPFEWFFADHDEDQIAAAGHRTRAGKSRVIMEAQIARHDEDEAAA